MKDTVKKVIDELFEMFKAEHRYYEMWEDDGSLCIDIHWGDWKHDHLYVKWKAKEALAARGLLVVREDSEVTEEDGSDCYSAIHTLKLREA